MTGTVVPPLRGADAWSSWTPNLPVLIAVVAAGVWYHAAARRARRDGGWSPGRVVSFDAGLLLGAWATCSWLGVYGRVLFWVFTLQACVLLLVVPLLLGAGAPVALAGRTATPAARTARLHRWIMVPGVGPLLLVVACGVLFLTPVLAFCLRHPAAYQGLPLVLVAVGLVLALPVTDEGLALSSTAYAALLGLGLFEFALDAVPGIVLRLRGTLVSPEYWTTVHRPWGPSPMADQQLAGDWLWFFGEAADLPFLIMLVIAWIRSDAREAAAADRALDLAAADRADSSVLREGDSGSGTGSGSGSADGSEDGTDGDDGRPWWETDPGVFGEERARRSGWGRPPG